MHRGTGSWPDNRLDQYLDQLWGGRRLVLPNRETDRVCDHVRDRVLNVQNQNYILIR